MLVMYRGQCEHCYYIAQASNDSVFSPTSSPASGDFTVELRDAAESTNTSHGIDVFGGADTVSGSPTVYIKTLTLDGLAASDGRLRAGMQRSFMIFSLLVFALVYQIATRILLYVGSFSYANCR